MRHLGGGRWNGRRWANSGELGKILKESDSNFFNIAFPHGNSITSLDKVKRYIEVNNYLIKLKSSANN